MVHMSQEGPNLMKIFTEKLHQKMKNKIQNDSVLRALAWY